MVSAVRSKWTLFYLGMIDVSVSQGSKANGKRKLKSGALFTGLFGVWVPACGCLMGKFIFGYLLCVVLFTSHFLLLSLVFCNSCLLCWENKTDLTVLDGLMLSPTLLRLVCLLVLKGSWQANIANLVNIRWILFYQVLFSFCLVHAHTHTCPLTRTLVSE